MKTDEHLRQTLRRIDRKGYKAYRDIQGEYQIGALRLAIDHVQGDPFAAPSRMRLIFERDDLNLPNTANRIQRVALEDYLARRFRQQTERVPRTPTGSGKSGLIEIDAGRQQVLERTACRVTDDRVELRLSVGLPAQGRTILGRTASTLLTGDLPEMGWAACRLGDRSEAERFIETVENAASLRGQLNERGLVAFVANGAILPRESGVSDRPLRGDVVPFESPPSLEVELQRLHGDPVRGMGIPDGATLIVGGGFHGKSTLLKALSNGVYNHIPGDGRELVVTRGDAVNIRAEDGRSVVGNDLTGFIDDLPLGRSTEHFSTENASGSTSQAANILEAIESGCRLMLMDEDTCATNFMIRDELMRALVPDHSEPITPFIDRVRQLYEQGGISTVLDMGGAGDYFSVADTVIWMDEYRPLDVTDRAKALARNARQDPERPWAGPVQRIPDPSSIDPTRRNRTRVQARGTEAVEFGRDRIDLRQVEQIVDPSQTRGIAEILVFALRSRIVDGQSTVSEILDRIEVALKDKGLDSMSAYRGHPGDFARPRRYEIAAALNRLRSLRVRQVPN
jgi:predicted ABC-class ATPase